MTDKQANKIRAKSTTKLFVLTQPSLSLLVKG